MLEIDPSIPSEHPIEEMRETTRGLWPRWGFEPTTSGLNHCCSINWATRTDGRRSLEITMVIRIKVDIKSTIANAINISKNYHAMNYPPPSLVWPRQSKEQRWSNWEVVGSNSIEVRDCCCFFFYLELSLPISFLGNSLLLQLLIYVLRGAEFCTPNCISLTLKSCQHCES